MVIFRVVGLALLSAILIIVIKQERPELAFMLSLVTGLLILILVLDQIGVIIQLLEQLVQQAHLDIMYFDTIIKILGIAYIGEFGAEITRDAGENSLAIKIEMAVKIIIMLLTIPILISLLETIIGMIPD